MHSQRYRRTLAGLTAGLAVVAGILLYAWFERADRRAIEGLPIADRVELFQRSTDELRALCDPLLSESLRDECRDRSEFLLLFPECDVTCVKLVSPFLDRPTR